jgi:hypothetical protein
MYNRCMPTRYAPGKIFDPGLAKAMGEAFTVAWELLKGSTAQAEAEQVRQSLALRIIDAGEAGERDPIKLSQDAIAHLATAKKRRAV